MTKQRFPRTGKADRSRPRATKAPAEPEPSPHTTPNVDPEHNSRTWVNVTSSGAGPRSTAVRLEAAGAESVAQMQRINVAWEELRDSDRRAAYGTVMTRAAEACTILGISVTTIVGIILGLLIWTSEPNQRSASEIQIGRSVEVFLDGAALFAVSAAAAASSPQTVGQLSPATPTEHPVTTSQPTKVPTAAASDSQAPGVDAVVVVPPAPTSTPLQALPPPQEAPPTVVRPTPSLVATPTPIAPSFLGAPQLAFVDVHGEGIKEPNGCLSGKGYTTADFTLILSSAATISFIRVQAWSSVGSMAGPQNMTIGSEGGPSQTVSLVKEANQDAGGYHYYAPIGLVPFDAGTGRVAMRVQGSQAFGLCLALIS